MRKCVFRYYRWSDTSPRAGSLSSCLHERRLNKGHAKFDSFPRLVKGSLWLSFAKTRNVQPEMKFLHLIFRNESRVEPKLYSPAKIEEYPGIFPNFGNCKCCEKHLKDNKHNSLHLTLKICSNIWPWTLPFPHERCG